MHDIRQSTADLQTILTGFETLFAGFTERDWGKAHGREWKYADVAYHLAYFNQKVLDSLGPARPDLIIITTRGAYNKWNDSQMAKRPAGQTGAQDFKYLQETVAGIARLAAEYPPETPVYLPNLLVGGWRTLEFAIDYLFYHSWSHLLEASLRLNGRSPDLPADVVNRAIRFLFATPPQILLPQFLEGVDLMIAINLTGEGGDARTFTLRDGKAIGAAGVDPNADTVITSRIETYMKTTFFGMQSPLIALLLGQTRIKGFRGAQEFQKIYSQKSDRPWKFVDTGRAEPPESF